MAAPTVAVIVCTHNRSRILAQCLETLAAQTASDADYEVIVVDNNSTDDTRAIVDRWAGAMPTCRYVLEERVGLSHARNRGAAESRAGYVAYVDDDCRLPRDWAGLACEIASSVRPAMFGGPYRACYDSSRPAWYRDDYASLCISDTARPLQHPEYLIGMNMAFRRDVLDALGGFDPDLGMTGDKLAYGEETALQNRIRERMPGETIYYDPRLYVMHLVRPEKMTLGWAARHQYADGLYYCRVAHPDDADPAGLGALVAGTARSGALLAKDLVRGLVRRRKDLYPTYQNFLYEYAFKRLFDMGYIRERYNQTQQRKGRGR